MKRRTWIAGLVVLGGNWLVSVPARAAVREQAGQREHVPPGVDAPARRRARGSLTAVPLGRARDPRHRDRARSRRRPPRAPADRVRHLQRPRRAGLPRRRARRVGQRDRHQGRLSSSWASSRATKATRTTISPPTLDLGRYRAVTIWCRRFSVNFATAPLTRHPDRRPSCRSLARSRSRSRSWPLAQGAAGPGRAGRHQVHDQGREHLEGRGAQAVHRQDRAVRLRAGALGRAHRQQPTRSSSAGSPTPARVWRRWRRPATRARC